MDGFFILAFNLRVIVDIDAGAVFNVAKETDSVFFTLNAGVFNDANVRFVDIVVKDDPLAVFPFDIVSGDTGVVALSVDFTVKVDPVIPAPDGVVFDKKFLFGDAAGCFGVVYLIAEIDTVVRRRDAVIADFNQGLACYVVQKGHAIVPGIDGVIVTESADQDVSKIADFVGEPHAVTFRADVVVGDVDIGVAFDLAGKFNTVIGQTFFRKRSADGKGKITEAVAIDVNDSAGADVVIEMNPVEAGLAAAGIAVNADNVGRAACEAAICAVPDIDGGACYGAVEPDAGPGAVVIFVCADNVVMDVDRSAAGKGGSKVNAVVVGVDSVIVAGDRDAGAPVYRAADFDAVIGGTDICVVYDADSGAARDCVDVNAVVTDFGAGAADSVAGNKHRRVAGDRVVKINAIIADRIASHAADLVAGDFHIGAAVNARCVARISVANIYAVITGRNTVIAYKCDCIDTGVEFNTVAACRNDVAFVHAGGSGIVGDNAADIRLCAVFDMVDIHPVAAGGDGVSANPEFRAGPCNVVFNIYPVNVPLNGVSGNGHECAAGDTRAAGAKADAVHEVTADGVVVQDIYGAAVNAAEAYTVGEAANLRVPCDCDAAACHFACKTDAVADIAGNVRIVGKVKGRAVNAAVKANAFKAGDIVFFNINHGGYVGAAVGNGAVIVADLSEHYAVAAYAVIVAAGVVAIGADFVAEDVDFDPDQSLLAVFTGAVAPKFNTVPGVGIVNLVVFNKKRADRGVVVIDHPADTGDAGAANDIVGNFRAFNII